MKRSLRTANNSGLTLSWLRSGGLCQVRSFWSDTHDIEEQVLDMGAGKSVFYRKLHADKKPTIVMVPGLRPHTHMDGKKAKTIFRYCDHFDFSCVLYDQECTGQSGDLDYCSKVMFSHWVEDALTVIDKLTEGPVVLVGESVGGWLSLIAAQEISAEKLHGLVLISPAVNHEWIDMKETINIDCPVRIISGGKEIDPEHLIELAASLKTKDVDLIYRKSSDHMLEKIYDLELLTFTVDRMLFDYPARQTLTEEEKLKAEEKKEKVLHDEIMRKIAVWEH